MYLEIKHPLINDGCISDGLPPLTGMSVLLLGTFHLVNTPRTQI